MYIKMIYRTRSFLILGVKVFLPTALVIDIYCILLPFTLSQLCLNDPEMYQNSLLNMKKYLALQCAHFLSPLGVLFW